MRTNAPHHNSLLLIVVRLLVDPRARKAGTTGILQLEKPLKNARNLPRLSKLHDRHIPTEPRRVPFSNELSSQPARGRVRHNASTRVPRAMGPYKLPGGLRGARRSTRTAVHQPLHGCGRHPVRPSPHNRPSTHHGCHYHENDRIQAVD